MTSYLQQTGETYRLVRMATMETSQLEQTLAEIQQDRHPYYVTTHPVVGDLQEELIDRLRHDRSVLERTVQSQQAQFKNLANRLEDLVHPTRYVPRDILDGLREQAVTICHRVGHVTADSLRRAAAEQFEVLSGHALAYVFADKRFKKIGFQRSTVPSNRGRFISVWTTAEE